MDACAPSAIPTFSILIETANLATADVSELDECLQTLAGQDLPVEEAREVILMHTGDVPTEKLERLRRDYPWLLLGGVGDISYADMKAQSTEITTGDVVVWADSDCSYDANWLRALLEPFAKHPDVAIVRGETALRVEGPYGLANALAFTFPRFSNELALASVAYYHANNVAFRRGVLERVPLPRDPSLYRAHFAVHSTRLRTLGYTIWRQPGARARHAPIEPNELPRRFVRLGRDSVNAGPLVQRAMLPSDDSSWEAFGLPERLTDRLRHVRGGWMRAARSRARQVFTDDPRALLQVPLALPVFIVCGVCFYAGRVEALVRGQSR